VGAPFSHTCSDAAKEIVLQDLGLSFQLEYYARHRSILLLEIIRSVAQNRYRGTGVRLRVSPETASGSQDIHVDVTVKNAGDREGKEVVQLCLSKRFASITPPLERLKRFAKIDLAPGKNSAFPLTLSPAAFPSSAATISPSSNREVSS
jgi:hypothetical protein